MCSFSSVFKCDNSYDKVARSRRKTSSFFVEYVFDPSFLLSHRSIMHLNRHLFACHMQSCGVIMSINDAHIAIIFLKLSTNRWKCGLLCNTHWRIGDNNTMQMNANDNTLREVCVCC
eukprot:76657_1